MQILWKMSFCRQLKCWYCFNGNLKADNIPAAKTVIRIIRDVRIACGELSAKSILVPIAAFLMAPRLSFHAYALDFEFSH